MPPDVGQTLSELEHKLQELERELRSFDDDGAPSPAPATAAPAPAAASAPPPPAPVTAPTAPDPAALAELRAFRDRLAATTHELLADLNRVLESVDRAIAAAPTTPVPPLVPPAAPTSSSPALGGSLAVPPPPTPRPPAPAPAAPGQAAVPGGPAAVQEGLVTVVAGPFHDIAVLGAFEQALASVAAVDDVYVRGFDEDRALIDVQLHQPVALAAELQSTSPVAFSVLDAGAGRLEVQLHG
ncbi:hypothetical protein [Conexibacter sp. SYSU D00693]|uniref:hypothetical protein n=1 Tax=Conexibacter sp. SYSU D00693 TaxID=2812560 RepID=UPI00196A6FEB|nr:hypothetical protein [Conexibacter sp. SYSU D00693]